jgi:hypothetical protein
MAQKESVTIYIDGEIWRQIKKELRDHGYPKGAPSWLAQQAYKQALRDLRERGVSVQLEMFEGEK